MFYRILILWTAIVPLAIANGAFRESVLNKGMPLALARAVSGILLMSLILGFSLIAVPWLGFQQPSRWFVTGALWLVWTLAFEFGFGRLVARKSWSELLTAYTFKGGELWPLVLVMVFFAPWLAAVLRGLC